MEDEATDPVVVADQIFNESTSRIPELDALVSGSGG